MQYEWLPLMFASMSLFYSVIAIIKNHIENKNERKFYYIIGFISLLYIVFQIEWIVTMQSSHLAQEISLHWTIFECCYFIGSLIQIIMLRKHTDKILQVIDRIVNCIFNCTKKDV